MKNLLSINGWYFKTFTKLANLMLLNILFILTSIPIVTSGISFMTLIQSLQELKTDYTLSATKVFIANFRKNVSKGVILFWIEIIGFLVPCFVIYQTLKYVPVLSMIIMISFSFLILLLLVFSFAYSINTYTVKRAFFKALKFVSLKIAYGIVLFIIPIVIIFLSVKYSIIFMVFIGFSLIVYTQIYIIEKAGILNESN